MKWSVLKAGETLANVRFLRPSVTRECVTNQFMPLLIATSNTLITWDDVVSQRLKFGSAFLSSSWDGQKLPCFFNFPVSRAHPEKLVWFLLAATSSHVQVSMFMWSAGLTKLKTYFEGFGSLFRKMEVLKVNKFGQTYRTGSYWNTGISSSRCEELCF